MKLTILGYWGAYPFSGAGTSAYLLESEGYHLLLDAGSGSLIELEQHLDPLSLNAVVLSHYHYDHIADIGVLQYYWQLHKGKKITPILPIYGHTEDAVQFKALKLKGVSEGIPYTANKNLDLGAFTIQFLPTRHPVPCFAMRIIEKSTGKILVFTGDSGYIPEFISFAEKADVFLADTYFLNGKENHPAHLTAGEAGYIAKSAEVGKLVLTHLPQQIDLNLLKEQAQIEAGENVPVLLAKKNLKIII